ncbi:MAG TPA: lipocalin-like domain-containing protein [Stellaceae bacterium]|nr:lipocalin-like domain-containing protein [Stellaceae bacterium]
MSEAARAAEALVGAWTLRSDSREILATGEKAPLLGAHPTGTLVYTGDGRVTAIVLADGRKAPEGLTASDPEAVALFRTMVAYAGRYTVEAERILHHVEQSWNAKWTGTDLVRFYKLEGSRLTLTTAPAPNPRDGALSVSTLVWERLP